MCFGKNFVSVKDKTTGAILLRGSSKQGVYPIQPTIVPPESSISAFLATKESGLFGMLVWVTLLLEI